MNTAAARWRNLTPEQQASFGNGCGAVKSWFDPPELIFEASCRQHDFYYLRGGGLSDKLRADFWFGWLMLRNAFSQRKLLSQIIYTPLALIYWAAVFLFGWFAFNWGRPAQTTEMIMHLDKQQKTQRERGYAHTTSQS